MKWCWSSAASRLSTATPRKSVPAYATRLGYSQLTLVDRIEELDLKNKRIRVRRKLEGRHEIVEAPLPAVLTVVREINHPRYPTVPMRPVRRVGDDHRME